MILPLSSLLSIENTATNVLSCEYYSIIQCVLRSYLVLYDIMSVLKPKKTTLFGVYKGIILLCQAQGMSNGCSKWVWSSALILCFRIMLPAFRIRDRQNASICARTL